MSDPNQSAPRMTADPASLLPTWESLATSSMAATKKMVLRQDEVNRMAHTKVNSATMNVPAGLGRLSLGPLWYLTSICTRVSLWGHSSQNIPFERGVPSVSFCSALWPPQEKMQLE